MLPGDNPRLAVIVPVYNNWTDTLECLDALAVQTTRDFAVVLADDGSPTPPPDRIRHWPRIQYLHGPNLGFGGNCNRAAEAALSQGATHLLFLNNDTRFGPDFIAGWLRAAVSHPGALLAPHIFLASEPERIWYSGGPFSLMTPFARKAHRYHEPTPVDIICGCALLVPSAEWHRIGGFDPAFRMYFEDFDFVLRAAAFGIRAYVIPDPAVAVLHKVSGSFRESGFWTREYNLIPARLAFVRQYYPWPRRLAVYGLAIVHFFLMLLANLPELPRPRLLRRAVFAR